MICGHPFGTKGQKAQAQIGRHVDKHFANLEKGAAPSRSGSSSNKGGGGFLDFVGGIIDAIVDT